MNKIILAIALSVSLLSRGYILANNEDTSYNNEIIRRDPFIPLVDEEGNFRNIFIKPKTETIASAMKIQLGGISTINGVSYVLIEGELFEEGDTYKGFKIEKIAPPEKAILSLRDKMYELSLEAQGKPKQK